MTVYYVDQSHSRASDRNSGTENSPWLTLQHAADTLQPGDTVYVKPGTYDPFEVTRSGTEGNPIVFASDPTSGERAVIDGAGHDKIRGVVESRGKSNFEIRGFEIKNGARDGIFIEGSPEGAGNIVVMDNYVHDTGNSGIYAAGLVMREIIPENDFRLFNIVIADNEVTRTNTPNGKNEAISVGGGVDGFEISGNHVHDSDQFGIDIKTGVQNGSIHDNVIHDLEKHGIYVDAANRTIKNVEIYNNEIYDNKNGIVLARETYQEGATPELQNVQIYNNDVYDNEQYGVLIYKHKVDNGTGLLDDVTITANDIHGNGANGVRLVSADFATNIVVEGNAIYGHKTNVVNSIGAEVTGNFNTPRDGIGVQEDLDTPKPEPEPEPEPEPQSEPEPKPEP